MKKMYFIIPSVTIVVAVLGNIFTSMGMDRYDTLMLHPATPAGSLIGTIRTLIFVYTTIAAVHAFKTLSKGNLYNRVLILFIINAILNTLRSFLFFDLHLLRVAFGEMILLEITNILLFVYMYRKAGLASWLMLPYIVRVALASFFAYQTAVLN